MIRRAISAVIAFMMIAACVPSFVAASNAENSSSVLVTAESETIGLGEKAKLRIRVSNVPEQGVSALLIIVKFDRNVKFSSSKFNPDIAGTKTTGTKDIDRTDHLERRFIWVLGADENGVQGAIREDFELVTCEFTLPANTEPNSVFSFGLGLSSDPKNCLDGNSEPIAVETVGCDVMVRDFEAPIDLSVRDVVCINGARVDVPFVFDGLDNVRGGLSSLRLLLSWEGNVECVSVLDKNGGEVKLDPCNKNSAVLSWTRVDPTALPELVASFRTSEGSKVGEVCKITPSIAAIGELLDSKDNVITHRLAIKSGEITVLDSIVDPESVLRFYAHDEFVGLGEKARIEVFAKNIPETGLRSASVTVKYPKQIKFLSGEFGDELDGVKIVSPDDIDLGNECGRTFIWMGNESLLDGEKALFACEFELPEGSSVGSSYEFGIEVSPDPNDFADKNGKGMVASSTGCAVTVRDFDSEFYFSAENASAKKGETVKIPLVLSGLENIRGGLASASFALDWAGELELLSVSAKNGVFDVKTDKIGDHRALVTCSEIGSDDSLELVASFMLTSAVQDAVSYDVKMLVSDGAGAFLTTQGVDVTDRLVIKNSSVTAHVDSDIMIGDADGSGRINAKDVTTVLKYMVGIKTENFVFDAADVDSSGKINAKDVTGILRLIAGSSSTPTLNTNVKLDYLSADANAFLSGTVFVGDSICRGLSAYGVLPADNVVAEDGAGAWNMFKKTFLVRGKDQPIADAVKTLDPKNIVIFMGMNDTWTTLGAFEKNYTAVIDAIKASCPKAKIYIASVTPVSSSCTYTTNENIDSFNAKLAEIASKNGFTFIDVSSALKDDNNVLSGKYPTGDGIHLPRSVYPVILGEICAKVVK